MSNFSSKEAHHQKMEEETTHILEEARMVVPGIQALFGFQLIVVFNSVFDKELSSSQKYLHLLAIATTTIALILNLAPAAYHRLAKQEMVSRYFITISTRFITWAMFILMGGICMDFFLITQRITQNFAVSLITIGCLFLVFLYFWVIFPKIGADRPQRGKR